MGSTRSVQVASGANRWLAGPVAVVIVATYLVACVLLYLGADDARWDHWIRIFERLAPLAGLAVGWIFGKEVHRREADDAKSEANRGRELAGAVRQELASFRSTNGEPTTAVAPNGSADASQRLQSLVNTVDRLFPP